MSYPYQAYAYVDDIVASGPSADLSVGGVPSGIPGTAVASSYTVATSSYRSWHPNERLKRRRGPTHVCGMAIFATADDFQYELNISYPRNARFQRTVATMTATLSAFVLGATFPCPKFEVKCLQDLS